MALFFGITPDGVVRVKATGVDENDARRKCCEAICVYARQRPREPGVEWKVISEDKFWDHRGS